MIATDRFILILVVALLGATAIAKLFLIKTRKP